MGSVEFYHKSKTPVPPEPAASCKRNMNLSIKIGVPDNAAGNDSGEVRYLTRAGIRKISSQRGSPSGESSVSTDVCDFESASPTDRESSSSPAGNESTKKMKGKFAPIEPAVKFQKKNATHRDPRGRYNAPRNGNGRFKKGKKSGSTATKKSAAQRAREWGYAPGTRWRHPLSTKVCRSIEVKSGKLYVEFDDKTKKAYSKNEAAKLVAYNITNIMTRRMRRTVVNSRPATVFFFYSISFRFVFALSFLLFFTNIRN